MIRGIITALIVIILDQLSKYYMMNSLLAEQSVIEITSFFNLVKAWNTGVSFSMFDNWGSVGVVVLSLVAIFIVAYLSWWLKTEKIKTIQISLGLIIGGALGNVMDRILLGAVFDFLDFHIGDQHWPAFNIADSFICLGAAIVILHSLFQKKDSSPLKN